MSQLDKFIRSRILMVLAIALFATALSGSLASARNVPGSAAIPLRELSEESTAEIMGGIHRGLLKVRGEIRGERKMAGFISMNADPNTADSLGTSGGFVQAGDTGAILNFGYRKIDNDHELDFDLFTGSALVFYATSPDLVLFGGPVAEIGDGDTPFNSGTLDSQGIGLAAGVDYRTGAGFYLSATAGFLALDYDFTRSDGDIDGSFNALRGMLDLQADRYVRSETMATDLAFGMRYIHQKNDSYKESGGADIDSSNSDTLSATMGGRAQFLTSAFLDPFAEADLRYDLIDDFALPSGIPEPDPERFHARLGLGLMREFGAGMIEAGGGLHLSDDEYAGFDVRLRAVIRF